MNNTPEKTSLEITTERAHHEFGPSRMEYLDNCAAFQNRQFTSEASEEGQMLHDLMEAMLQQVKAKSYLLTLPQIEDWVTVNNELTPEQVVYLRFCCKRVDEYLVRNPSNIHTELNVSVTDKGVEFNHGYLDVLFEWPTFGVLIDFKFGYIPVPHAEINLQGKNYAAGVFQMFPNFRKIAVKFYQPKIDNVTEAIFHQTQLPEIIGRLQGVVGRAKYVQNHPAEAQRFMAPGAYCEYCKNADTCAVLANHRALFAKQFHQLPLPSPIAGLRLDRPEDWALARYWVDVIDTGLEDFKKRAMEVAELNGGELRCVLPNGEEVVYQMKERGADRVLGSAPEVADVLKEYITEAEVLGAAKLSLGALEPIVKSAMVEAAKAAGAPKLTKKAAWELATSTLEANGLLSKPDTKIRFLQLKKQQKVLAEPEQTPPQQLTQ